MLNILIAVGFMAVLGLVLATVLVIANRRLYVYEDPKIDLVEDMLPHANCGACGTAGCRVFAEKLVTGESQPGACTVNSAEMNQQIASFLGVELGSQEQRVARLACAGGNNVARRHGDYQGVESCRAATLVSGGGKGCVWGCLGLGDCERVCDFDAIIMDAHDLPQVINDKCTACGDCVDICPRDLFSLQPVSNKLWVACKNLEKGEAAEAECAVACNGCGRCALDAPGNLIAIDHHLAVIDYTKNALASRIAIERCPTGAIVWLEDGVQKGHDAFKIIRKEPLPLQ
ncbi:MAG: RnfABCDGE type electron transport complex subunit B [Gammaproteobacteria bacterium]|nr:RnfABCDGE type electron transport complex subunit B [Gammaproteobacteria bacterium]